MYYAIYTLNDNIITTCNSQAELKKVLQNTNICNMITTYKKNHEIIDNMIFKGTKYKIYQYEIQKRNQKKKYY